MQKRLHDVYPQAEYAVARQSCSQTLNPIFSSQDSHPISRLFDFFGCNLYGVVDERTLHLYANCPSDLHSADLHAGCKHTICFVGHDASMLNLRMTSCQEAWRLELCPDLEEDDGLVELVQGMNWGALNVGLLVLRVWPHQAVTVPTLELVGLLSQ